jgi:hypothetical protein
MKQPNYSYRNRTRGEGLVIVIILVAIIGAGTWWLFSTKKQSEQAARTFGRDVIEHLAIQHDQPYFSANLGPQAKAELTDAQQKFLVAKLTELGVPAQPIKIDENITFESKFFEPKGFFTAHLNYPSQPVTMQIAVSHPVGKWQVDDMTVTWPPGH